MEQKRIEQSIRLKILIKALNLNQLSFAQSIEMTQPNISKMMNGERQLSIEMLNRISDRYRVNLHWLLTGTGEMFVDEPLANVNTQVNEDPAVYRMHGVRELEERVEHLEEMVRALMAPLSSKL